MDKKLIPKSMGCGEPEPFGDSYIGMYINITAFE